jgi:putative molybdopterin biosynthesis protein
MINNMEPRLLTAEDVAQQLRIKKYTVYELIKRGELPSSRVGTQVRVSQADIEKYLAAGKTGKAGADRIREKAEAAREGLPGEREAAPARQIIISGQDKCLDLLLAKIGSETGGEVLRSYTGCYNSLFALYFG